ncbi:MAG TPA: chemotaxis protein CheX [Armatimonadetes bacterium]|jgi:chemotaxis protein CheX|nr:chemotaxis protein CheX [Armatimonadota bacterium]
MKIEFIDPFLRAAFEVLEQVLQERPERGQLSMRNATFTSQQVTIVHGVVGMVEGSVLYGMSLVTAEKIASTMIGSPLMSFDDLANSAISELGDMVTGNAATYLSNAGYQCNITPPSVMRGANLRISTITPALVVPVNTVAGRLEINIALQERKSPAG